MKSTFRDSEETKEHNAIAMCSSEAIEYVSDREIDRPVFIVSRSDRYSCFITTENDGAKDRAMRFRILGNNVLNTMSVSLNINEVIARTYRLFPRPICGHEVTKAMDSVGGALLEGRIIKTRLEIRVGEHIMDQCTGIPEPDIILCFHPQRNIVYRLGSIILKANGFPWDVAKRSGIDGAVHAASV